MDYCSAFYHLNKLVGVFPPHNKKTISFMNATLLTLNILVNNPAIFVQDFPISITVNIVQTLNIKQILVFGIFSTFNIEQILGLGIFFSCPYSKTKSFGADGGPRSRVCQR